MILENFLTISYPNSQYPVYTQYQRSFPRVVNLVLIIYKGVRNARGILTLISSQPTYSSEIIHIHSTLHNHVSRSRHHYHCPGSQTHPLQPLNPPKYHSRHPLQAPQDNPPTEQGHRPRTDEHPSTCPDKTHPSTFPYETHPWSEDPRYGQKSVGFSHWQQKENPGR